MQACRRVTMMRNEQLISLPTGMTSRESSHSRSYAAVLEVLYGVSWVTKGYWQSVWRA